MREPAQRAADAGVPAGVAQLVHGDADLISRTLIASRVIRKVSFTGSTAAGRKIGAICGGRIARFTLELGGKSAAVILDDADLGSAAGVDAVAARAASAPLVRTGSTSTSRP